MLSAIEKGFTKLERARYAFPMYRTNVGKKQYQFSTLNQLLGKANELRSGDKSIGLAAEDEKERVAAQKLLADLPLKTLYENPAVPYESCEVTRTMMDGLDSTVYRKLASW